MHSASQQYKSIMANPYRYRNRGYMSVAIAVVNNVAQSVSKFSGDYEYAYWSNKTLPFSNKKVENVYATFEQNFFKADGSQYIMPPNDEYMQLLQSTGIASQNILNAIEVEFDKKYEIKGLTIDFGDAYPTKFQIDSEEHSYIYEISDGHFETTDLMGDTSYILITPITMVGGQQRLRIQNILMGVGLNYTNDDIQSATYTENVSSFSTSLPSYNFSLTILDKNKEYDVDNEDSFANFLHTEQDVKVSVGLELDSGEIEWIQIANLSLANWKTQSGKMSFTAKDKFSFMDETYSAGNSIGEKNLWDAATGILRDLGLETDQYILDDYLRDVSITNPIPTKKHKECLQLIANAARCKLYQNYEGKICIIANFSNVLEPDDIEVDTSYISIAGSGNRQLPMRLSGESLYSGADSNIFYSKPENAIFYSSCVYATFERDFFKADGSQYILPTSSPYLETSYVSDQISDENGLFSQNPVISLILPAAYSYYTISISFYGNAPLEMRAIMYKNGETQSQQTFYDLSNENLLSGDFLNFDKISFEFVKTYPNNRISVNKISFGDLSDYVLTRHNMMDEPIGYRDEMIKTVYTRICTFQNNEQGHPQQVNDSVWVENEINSVGVPAKFENPLIGTETHARLINEWLSEDMLNNVTYNINHRGEPRLEATDIIFMDGSKGQMIQCEIESNKFSFNGAFSGTLSLRKMRVNK